MSDIDTPDSTDTPLIAVAVMSSGRPTLSTVDSIFKILDPAALRHGRVGGYRWSHSGPYLDVGRNQIIHWFLASTEADALLLVDDDILFTPEDVDALLSWFPGYDFISGTYANLDRYVGHCVCAYDLVDAPDTEEYATRPVFIDGKWFAAIPADDCPTSPRRVDAVGAGFMLVSRNLLLAMADEFDKPDPWFCEPTLPARGGGGINVGEDHGFCLRARGFDARPWLVPTPGVRHLKVIPLGLPVLHGGAPNTLT